MISVQRIQIQAMCKHHSLPFVYICIARYCQCQIKLCEKCLTQHESENQNSNVIKIQNFCAKIQAEVGIANKQKQSFSYQENSTISNSLIQSELKLEKFALNQITVLEDSMKSLNQECYQVKKQIKDSSTLLATKMQNINLKRKQLPQTYCKKVLQNNLLQNFVNFYSQKGFSNFRKKLDKTLRFRAIVKDFLSYAQKFGNKYDQLIKSSSSTVSNQWSIKNTVSNLIKGKNNSKFENMQGNQNRHEKNIINQQNINQRGRQKRSRTIFGKI